MPFQVFISKLYYTVSLPRLKMLLNEEM